MSKIPTKYHRIPRSGFRGVALTMYSLLYLIHDHNSKFKSAEIPFEYWNRNFQLICKMCPKYVQSFIKSRPEDLRFYSFQYYIQCLVNMLRSNGQKIPRKTLESKRSDNIHYYIPKFFKTNSVQRLKGRCAYKKKPSDWLPDWLTVNGKKH